MIRSLLIAGVMALCFSAPALAENDNIGERLPQANIEGLAQSPAGSLDELAGRVVLIEFFAYW
ncbi:MAG: hypothetical protein JKY61_07260 [Planctomycetes bacterium]|nr:hypothetical protein [Planctomycetota bacterium]